jgi:hypothetical protein
MEGLRATSASLTLSHDAAAGGASAERAESVVSTEREESGRANAISSAKAG